MTPTIELTGSGLRLGSKTLWAGLDLDVQPGEFVAVVGANGSGKSSLLKALLGQRRLTEGSARVCGLPPGKANGRIGYVPQLRTTTSLVPMRGIDFVELGRSGSRWGLPRRTRHDGAVADLLAAADAASLGRRPVGLMSGGEQQRLRVLQAIASDPDLLLCDEPLLSLDPRYQQLVVEMMDAHRRHREAAVLFVTHELNPVLPVTDRVLYLAAGQFRFGRPDEVMTSSVLSELYQSPVEVVRRGDRIAVLGADDGALTTSPSHGHHDGVGQQPRRATL